MRIITDIDWASYLRNVQIVLVLFTSFTKDVNAYLPAEINVGGLFEYDYKFHRLAFEYAIDDVNRRKDILPHTKLVPDIEYVRTQDSYHTSRKSCQLLQRKVAAVFSQLSGVPSAQVQSICDSKGIPHVETQIGLRQHDGVYSINLHPHPSSYGKFLFDVVKSYGWSSFTILYEEDSGFIRFQSLVTTMVDDVSINYKKLTQDGGDYSHVLKYLAKQDFQRLIIDCDVKIIPALLIQMNQLKMLTEYYHIVFTSLDMDIVNLDPYLQTGTNITTFRLVEVNNPLTVAILNDWKSMRSTGNSPLGTGIYSVMTDLALIYDGVLLFAKALHDLSRHMSVVTGNLSCFDDQVWSNGDALLNQMHATQIHGLTGSVHFDKRNDRTEFDLDIVELTSNGLEKTGTWNHKDGVNFTRTYSQVVSRLIDTLANKTLRVTTVLEKPFTMLRSPDANGQLLTGNDRFEGFCIDMLKEISIILNFSYSINLVKDKQYGAPYKDGSGWNGMVGELLRKEADIAVAPLTISLIRHQVIDFTKPFMTTGLSILFKQPKKESPGLFSFLSPLSAKIWMYVGVAYTVVSLLVFILARFSPYEWYNPHPCNEDSDIVENQFNLLNSLWFTVGSLMQQGSDFAPRALSTRLLSGTWWFFTLIVISSYTANLAAFLTVERMKAPIENADDLSKQTKIKYGTLWGGSSMTFFQQSKIPTYNRMWNYMSSADPSVFVNSSEEAFKKILRPEGQDYDYAYLLESAYRDYAISENCELMSIGGLLDNKGYGIGVPRGSPYRDILSSAILKLQDEQTIQFLQNKWWKKKDGGKECENKESSDGAGASERLDLQKVGGVFVVLLVGLAVAVVVAFIEFIVNARHNADEDKQSLCSEMMEELRFAIRCMGSSKKPAKKKKRVSNLVDNGMTLIPLTASAGLHSRISAKESIA